MWGLTYSKFVVLEYTKCIGLLSPLPESPVSSTRVSGRRSPPERALKEVEGAYPCFRGGSIVVRSPEGTVHDFLPFRDEDPESGRDRKREGVRHRTYKKKLRKLRMEGGRRKRHGIVDQKDPTPPEKTGDRRTTETEGVTSGGRGGRSDQRKSRLLVRGKRESRVLTGTEGVLRSGCLLRESVGIRKEVGRG